MLRKKSILLKKSTGSPVNPSNNINNQTIDIGDENKIKSNDIFADIEVANLIQPVLNNFAPIPNSFDMFANDLNKQTILNSPPSSTSSSTCSLNSNKMYYNNNNRGALPINSKLANYKANAKILTSSIDKDLNKIASSTPTAPPPASHVNRQEQIRPKSSAVTTATTSTTTTVNAPAPQRSTMIPSFKSSTGIPVPAKSLIPQFRSSMTASSGQVLRNSTNNNIAIKVSQIIYSDWITKITKLNSNFSNFCF